MPAEVFVDTSAWYPLVVRAHADHERVSAAVREEVGRRRRLVTTNLVIAETHALILRRAARAAALTFAQTVGESPNVVVHSTPKVESAAVRDWLERYSDQPFSYTDAVSFAVMTDRRIKSALTLDHHFAVAGFDVLPSLLRRGR